MKPRFIWLLLGLWACFRGQAETASPESARTHWAFQPLRPRTPPEVRNVAWTKNALDRFLLAGMEARGISPAPPAASEQLVRRTYLDLIGLPPAVAELDAYVQSTAPDKFERLVDRLLASPAYGERWARHWLDLARYAESDGFEHDAARPHTWRYRDYVIAAFNQDKPYDQFLLEQIAGDELWPDRPEALIATGFNLLGPDMVDSADPVQRRLNTLNDMTDTAASVMLGLTFGCARCHDHKFEPFTQRDYYRWQAFFAPAALAREQPVLAPPEAAAHQAAQAGYERATRATRDAIAALEAPCRQRLLDGKLAQLSEDAQLAHRTPRAQRTKEQEGTVRETAAMVAVTDMEVEKALSPADRARRQTLREELNRVPEPPAPPLAMGLRGSLTPSAPTYVLVRGDYNHPREQVEPGFPEVLTGGGGSPPLSPSPRRAALARWLASAENPLTARVMVNRIWQHHFGRGLVATPSDFGLRGRPPSHPELLDWLAGEFIRSGWSLKAMHRLILASAAYQQSSVAVPAVFARDPENRWFSRQNRTRLEGEVIRDSLLAISGQLNLTMGGPSVQPAFPSELTLAAKNRAGDGAAAAQNRRSIYVFAWRNLRFPFFEVFDAPDCNLTCPERGRSTTAPQALTLLNSREVMDAARATARQIAATSRTPEQQIEISHRMILGRPPSETERALAAEFFQATAQRLADRPSRDRTQPAESALAELCRALFNLNAFVYAE